MSANRPLSPHLHIYRPQITSVLSIMHRVTGLLLCLGAVVLIAWIAAAAAGPDAYADYRGIANSLLGRLLLLGLVFSLLFHLANGIRHLVWDMGYGYGLDTTAATGWVVVATSPPRPAPSQ